MVVYANDCLDLLRFLWDIGYTIKHLITTQAGTVASVSKKIQKLTSDKKKIKKPGKNIFHPKWTMKKKKKKKEKLQPPQQLAR